MSRLIYNSYGDIKLNFRVHLGLVGRVSDSLQRHMGSNVTVAAVFWS